MFKTGIAIFAMALSFSGAAFAAEPAPSPSPPTAASEVKPTDVKEFGDWAARCFPIKSLAPCDMFQATLERATGRRIVSVSIAYAPSKDIYVAKIIVPLNLKITAGLVVTADKYKSKPLAYSRCENDGCYVEGPLKAALIDNLANGKSASILITSYAGGRITLPLSLNGFADSAAAMKALAIQKNQ